jgi:hypothetical protein
LFNAVPIAESTFEIKNVAQVAEWQNTKLIIPCGLYYKLILIAMAIVK